MKKLVRNLILIFAASAALQGCLNLKSEYPKIEYYRLKQIESGDVPTGPVKGILQIRDFTISDELETTYFLALWDNTRIQRFYYHRWITDCSEMVTDFFNTRFNMHNYFEGGVIRPSSVIVPDFIMEGQILDMIAHNSKSDNPGANKVVVSLRITVLKRIVKEISGQIIHTKVYEIAVPRDNYYATSIPMAFSQAYSALAGQIINDVQQKIAEYQKSLDKEETETFDTPGLFNK